MILLQCKNHPDLYWYCKQEAVTAIEGGQYTGARRIFYHRALSKMKDECHCEADQLVTAGALPDNSWS